MIKPLKIERKEMIIRIESLSLTKIIREKKRSKKCLNLLERRISRTNQMGLLSKGI